MFRKVAVTIPSVLGKFLEPEQVVQLLAAPSLPSYSVSWVYVDRPVDGTVMVFTCQSHELIPDDGYGWMDLASHEKVLVGGKSVDVYTKKLGFGFGENVVTMMRKRYRVAGSDYQVLHYLKSHVPKMVVQSEVKTPARVPSSSPTQSQIGQFQAVQAQAQAQLQAQAQAIQAQHAQIQQAQVQAQQAQVQAQIQSQQSQAQAQIQAQLQAQQIQIQARKRKTAQTPVVRVEEPEHDVDDSDHSYGRIIALERYKRNHIMIDQVFSGHVVSTFMVKVEQIPYVVDDDAKASKLKQLEANVASVEEMRAKFTQTLDLYKSRVHQEWKSIEELKHARTIPELEAAQAKYASIHH